VFSVERGSHRETFEIIGLLGLLILVFEETKLKKAEQQWVFVLWKD
jgi:hypothetical protein